MPAKETSLLQDLIRGQILRAPVLQQSSIAIQLLWFPLLTSQPIRNHHCKSFLPGSPHPNPFLLNRRPSSLTFTLGSKECLSQVQIWDRGQPSSNWSTIPLEVQEDFLGTSGQRQFQKKFISRPSTWMGQTWSGVIRRSEVIHVTLGMFVLLR